MLKKNVIYLICGVLFGVLLTKSEVISWFRIQEMFRFQSFHMYGIIFSAIVVAFLSLQLIKRFQWKSMRKTPMTISPKPLHKGVLIGGVIFGLGWAATGACPGPLYALVGTGYTIILVPLLAAVVGAYAYGALRDKLPH